MTLSLLRGKFLAISLVLLLQSCTDSKTGTEPAIPTFQNPVFAGFYPDPSICKAGSEYYMVHSSFSYFPGLPIFKSEDLVNWEQIGHVMDRPSQLDTEGQGVSRGLFAPTITHYKGTFYVTCTHVDNIGNFIVTATDPSGPWSEPIQLPEVDGIDPSLFFEEDRAFIVYNSIPPNNESLYNGHRSIRMYELDFERLQVKGEQYLLVDGGVDMNEKPVWIEAPHIYHIKDFYYLMCAEGGTGYNHSEVIFRSIDITGPYEPWDQNPILTQRHLDSTRDFPVTTTGHADLIEANGNWWAVFLGCRPYGDDLYNIGRETFLAPVKWTEDDWPIINPDFGEIQYSYPTPFGNEVDKSKFQYAGNFSFTDEFDHSELAFHYTFLRTPKEEWYEISNGQLTMQLRPETTSGTGNPSFIGHRQQHHKGIAQTELIFTPDQENEKAGLVFFQSETNYYYFCKSIFREDPVVELYQSQKDSLKLLSRATIGRGSVYLRVSFDDDQYDFSYSVGNQPWIDWVSGVDGTFLSTKVAGGFVGTVIGMYATSNGESSDNAASFGSFTYLGNDDVFNQKN